MGRFRDNDRGGDRRFGNRRDFNGNNNRRSGGFGNRRSFGNNGSERREMFEATCSKCGKSCQVPFRPTGNKPVLCSDCFRNNDGAGQSFSPRNSSGAQGMTADQFRQLNEKLDKVIALLESLELVEEDADSDSDFDEDEE